MSYLYGDSTASTLRSNFLEFLRDALDFGVFVVLSDLRIRQGKNEIVQLERAANEECARLEALGELTVNAVEHAPVGATESATSRCAAELRRMAQATVEQAIAGVRAQLHRSISEVNVREANERKACAEALGKLLLPHDPWDAICDQTIVLRGEQPTDLSYAAHATGVSQTGFAWTLHLTVPQGHPMAEPMRIERVVPQLEVAVPEMAGWLKKEVKVKPQRLERHFVTEVFLDDDVLRAKLRAEPLSDAGFDLEITKRSPRVKMARTGAKDAAVSGPFEVRAEDEETLLAFADKLRATVNDLTRARVVEVTYEEKPAHEIADLRALVERLVDEMAPIVREISEHSQSPNELVIKRLLGGDRREEIFVSKASLLEKLNGLAPEALEIFDKLSLAPTRSASLHVSRAPEARAEQTQESPEAAHAQLLQSVAPPNAGPPARASAPPPATASANGMAGTTANGSVHPQARASAPPPASPSAAPAARTSAMPPSTAVAPDGAPPSTAAAPDSSPNGLATSQVIARADAPAKASIPAPANAELAQTIKQIVAMAKRGKSEDAYRAYSELFASERFTTHPPEHQRQALRLMVLAKAPPQPTDTSREAHRVAADRLRALIKEHDHPADYEMLGICQVVLDEPQAASATFSTALELERKKNPGSELCGNLMRRVASL